MKKRYLVGLISALMIVGCGSNGNSSNNSSILNNSNSSTSSSTIDTTGWIANGDESFAINNPNSWVYSVDDNVKTTLAMENEGELYFYYNKSGTVSWNSAQLFYHSSSLKVGNGYNVVLSLSSSIAGKITINGEVVEIKEGLNDLTISSVLEENKSAISIQFGTADNGAISDNLEIVISSFSVNKKANAKDIITEALNAKNYTITLSEGMNGYEVTSKFFENAAHFDWKNTIDGVGENYGFAENETGCFRFSKNNETIKPGSNYLVDAKTGEKIKGLYSSNYEFTYSGLEGLPSLNRLDLDKFDYDLETGEKIRISDGSSLRALTFMLDDQYATYYFGGIYNADILLHMDGSLEFIIKTRLQDVSKFVLSNIGTTTDEAIENFVNSSDFCPSSDASTEGNLEVEEMLDVINGSNYSVNKGTIGEFFMNEKYSYDVSFDSETGEEIISGYIKLSDGVYSYRVEDNQVVLGDNYSEMYSEISEVSHLAGLTSGNISYFKDASKYIENDVKGYFEMVPTDNSYLTFGTKWFGKAALGCNLVTLEKGVNNITIGANLSFADGAGVAQDYKMHYLVVYNIDNTTVNFMEEYLNSLEA